VSLLLDTIVPCLQKIVESYPIGSSVVVCLLTIYLAFKFLGGYPVLAFFATMSVMLAWTAFLS
jgi:hypothetical protein